MSLHNWILNFEKITELPLTGSSTSRLPALAQRAASVRRRGHLAGHTSRPRPIPPHAHGLSQSRSVLASSPHAMSPRRRPCVTRRRRRHAAPPPRRRLPWPGLPQAAAPSSLSPFRSPLSACAYKRGRAPSARADSTLPASKARLTGKPPFRAPIA